MLLLHLLAIEGRSNLPLSFYSRSFCTTEGKGWGDSFNNLGHLGHPDCRAPPLYKWRKLCKMIKLERTILVADRFSFAGTLCCYYYYYYYSCCCCYYGDCKNDDLRRKSRKSLLQKKKTDEQLSRIHHASLLSWLGFRISCTTLGP